MSAEEYARFVVDGGRPRIRRAWTPASVVLAFALIGCSGPTLSPSLSPAPGTSAPSQPLPSSPLASQPPSPSATLEPIVSPIAVGPESFAILPATKPAGFVGDIKCTGSIGASDPVAIVQLHGPAFTGPVVLRDYASISQPRTACTFGKAAFPIVQLIDSGHLVIGGENASYAVVDLPDVHYHWFQLPVSKGLFAVLISVSPALDEIAWKVEDPAGTATDTIHLTTGAGDRVVATLPDTNGGRCGVPDVDSAPGGYTRSGGALFVLDTPIPESSLLVLEGATVVLSNVPPKGTPIGSSPLKALWSPTSETLYFEQGGDTWKWTKEAGRTRYLPGVAWTDATIAPDGAHLAYAVKRADGLHDVYLVDLAHDGRPVRIGKGANNLPMFLNSTQLWFRPETSGPGCTGPVPPGPVIYNVTNGTSAPSIIDNVRRVWPATSTIG
jgi:hypothetical protein